MYNWQYDAWSNFIYNEDIINENAIKSITKKNYNHAVPKIK